MRILQWIIRWLFSLLIFVAGALLLFYAIDANTFANTLAPVQPYWDQLLNDQLWQIIAGGVAAVLGLFGAIPIWGKSPQTVHFQNQQGSVVINVKSLERYLREVLLRMPEVDDIDIDVVPIKKGRRVRIDAFAKITQPVTASGRQTSDRVTDLIKEAATSFIGLDEDTQINLRVDTIDIDVEEASRVLKESALPMPEASRTLGYSGPLTGQGLLGERLAATTGDPANDDYTPASYSAGETTHAGMGEESGGDPAHPEHDEADSDTSAPAPTDEAPPTGEASYGGETGSDAEQEEKKEKKGGWGLWGT